MKKSRLVMMVSGLAIMFSLSLSSTITSNDIAKVITKNFTDSVTDVILTFDGNGGTISGKNVIKTKSNVAFKDILDKPNVTRDGYADNPGWVYGSDSTLVSDTTTFSSDTTLKANWLTYTVTFDSGDGKFSDESTSKTITKGKIYSDEIEIPTCENKAFEGWYINTTKQTFPYIPSSNVTLTAKYTSDTTNIVVTANGGYFGTTTSDTFKIFNVSKGITWSELSSRSDFPKTINHSSANSIFCKWKNNGADLNNTDIFTSPTVINASFESAATVTFNVSSNSGEWSDSTTTSKSAKIKLGSSGNNPTYGDFKTAAGVVDANTHSKTTNYALLGWFDDAAATNSAIKDSDIVSTSGNHNVYAYYKVPYSINYEGDTSGYTKTTAPTTFLRKDTVTIKLTQNTGYTLASTIKIYKDSSHSTEFSGFTYSLSSGVGTITITDAPGTNLYIVPTAPINYYTVTVNAETGKGTVTGTGSYYYNQEVTCSLTGTTNGYKFKGWYVGSTQKSTSTTYKFNVTSAITVTAKFDLVTYSITYKDGSTTLSGLSPTTYNVESTTFSLPTAPTKTDYEFANWYTESSLTNKLTQIVKGSTGNKTLYASYLSTTNKTNFLTCNESLIADAATVYENGDTSKLFKIFNNGSSAITSLTGFLGLERSCTVNGKTHKYKVIGTNHDLLTTQPSGKSNVNALFTFEFSTIISDSDGNSLGYQWADVSNNYTYINSTLRYSLNRTGGHGGRSTNTILAAQKGSTTWSSTYNNKSISEMLPASLTASIKPVTKSVAIKSSGVYTQTTFSDNLFLLSPTEIGHSEGAETSGHTVYEYYSGKSDSYRIKRQVNTTSAYTTTATIASGSGQAVSYNVTNYAGYHVDAGTSGSGGYVWLRSPFTTGGGGSAWPSTMLWSTGGLSSTAAFQSAFGVCPAFCY